MDTRQWAMSLPLRLSDLNDLIAMAFDDEHPAKSRKVVKTRFSTIMSRYLPTLSNMFGTLSSGAAFDLYVRLHKLWDGESRVLDLTSMEVVEDIASSTATKSILAQDLKANTPAARVVLLEEHSKRFSKAAGSDSVSTVGVGDAATGQLTYSSANASRVKKVMESPHFPRYKTLLTHLQEDASEMHRELFKGAPFIIVGRYV